MKLHLLRTTDQQAQGVIGLDKLEPDDVFFFPGVGWRWSCFHMQGVPFDISIAFLDGNFRILQVALLQAQVGLAVPPWGTQHAAEADATYFQRHGLTTGMEWTELREKVEHLRKQS